MTEANTTEPNTEWWKRYDGEATTAGTVKKMLINLKNGARSSTAEERCDNG